MTASLTAKTDMYVILYVRLARCSRRLTMVQLSKTDCRLQNYSQTWPIVAVVGRLSTSEASPETLPVRPIFDVGFAAIEKRVQG